MKRLITILLSGLMFMVGLGILAYPTVSNWLNQKYASHALKEYFQQTDEQSDDQFQFEFDQARIYNASLTGTITSLLEAADMEEANIQSAAYWDTLDAVNGIMGAVEIPSVNISLPIYHGTDETTLQQGVGHLEGSALPTGDIGDHTVLTGHTGLPSAELFTDLDMLQIGDTFYIEILNRTYTYEIEHIYTVLPTETQHLVAQPDKNLVTLVTCTPYGINSHRLLVQGSLVDTDIRLSTPSDQETNTPETEVPLALQHIPALICIAAIAGLLFIGAIIRYLMVNKYSPKRLTDQTEPH